MDLVTNLPAGVLEIATAVNSLYVALRTCWLLYKRFKKQPA